jgi:hypothetical protein
MKIVITNEEGDILYEESNPGYIHLPIIMDGMYDLDCDDDDCKDPRCVKRGEEALTLIRQWVESSEELAFYYHFSDSSGGDIEEFEMIQPDTRVPKKVKLTDYLGKQIIFASGERVKFRQPRLNAYSSDQVMFETDRWGASLVPWREHHDQSAKAKG